MPTPARREISAIDTSASGSANAVRAAVRILSRLRLASARLAGAGNRFAGIRASKWTGYPVIDRLNGQAIHLPTARSYPFAATDSRATQGASSWNTGL